MPWRCDFFAGYAKSAQLVKSALKRYTQMAGTSGDEKERAQHIENEEERAQLVWASRTNEC